MLAKGKAMRPRSLRIGVYVGCRSRAPRTILNSKASWDEHAPHGPKAQVEFFRHNEIECIHPPVNVSPGAVNELATGRTEPPNRRPRGCTTARARGSIP
jgi:hypothetical protein